MGQNEKTVSTFGLGKEQSGLMADKGQNLNLKEEMLLLQCRRSTYEKWPAVYKAAYFILVWHFPILKPFHIYIYISSHLIPTTSCSPGWGQANQYCYLTETQ